MRFFSIENKITKLKIQISNKTQFSKNQFEKIKRFNDDLYGF
jgi:hypothetical protein